MGFEKNLSDKSKEKFFRFLSDNEELKSVSGYSSLHLREKFVISLLFPGIIFITGGALLAFIGKFQFILGIVIGLIIAIAVAVAMVWIVNRSHSFILTTRRVILREGFFNIKIASALYDKITHISVDQGPMDRFVYRHGTVTIDTAGSTGDEIILKYVEEPIEFKNFLENLIHQHHRNESDYYDVKPAKRAKPTSLKSFTLFHTKFKEGKKR